VRGNPGKKEGSSLRANYKKKKCGHEKGIAQDTKRRGICHSKRKATGEKERNLVIFGGTRGRARARGDKMGGQHECASLNGSMEKLLTEKGRGKWWARKKKRIRHEGPEQWARQKGEREEGGWKRSRLRRKSSGLVTGGRKKRTVAGAYTLQKQQGEFGKQQNGQSTVWRDSSRR